ncbi:MAG: hypothetical protein KDD46_01115 [Bdellovibrionales bacterium]|nr:hypothetical protein [Bdellovibrionales bacterium]
MYNKFQHNRSTRAYAIVVVMILIIIGTGVLLFANKESLFFTKVVGFFNRSKQIQIVAESGAQLAQLDLVTLSQNVLLDDYSAVDVFTNLAGEDPQVPIDQGLHVYQVVAGQRTVVPRFTKQEGNISLEVYYFPEDPCDGGCASEVEYNEKIPKFFNVVSQATHQKTNEVFTVETRVQVRLENFSEIAFGVTGVTNFPVVSSSDFYKFVPSISGRTHFNIPENRIEFANPSHWMSYVALTDTASYNGESRLSTFLGPVTFENSDLHDYQGDEDLPFRRGYSPYTDYNVTIRPILDFKKGLDTGVNLVSESGEDSYVESRDPSTDAYFDTLHAVASGGFGQDLSDIAPCQVNHVTGHNEANVCLKLRGNEVLRYDCNVVDGFVYPVVDRVIRANDDDLDVTAFPDQYLGERADVFGGSTANAQNTYSANGVFYCRNSGCDCNIHIKGLYEGNLTVAADNVVIAGDIVNNDQDPVNSTNMFGAIAKHDLIIPPGIPQGSQSIPYGNGDHNTSNLPSNDPPFQNCTSPFSGCTAASLGESYLGITNFIAHDGTQYTDRDIGNDLHLPFSNWINPTQTGHSTDYYNNPMSLDLDGHFIAGNTLKIDGIFNPEVSISGNKGIAVLTCENPGTSDKCRDLTSAKFKYREPTTEYSAGGTLQTNNPLYVFNTGTGQYDRVTSSDGEVVEPVFWGDGLHLESWNSHINPGLWDDTLVVFEELSRMRQQSLNVFGSLNAKFFLLNSRILNFPVGFNTKIIVGDPRAGASIPPSFPFTLNIIFDELYRKAYHGTSKLLNP